MIYAGDITDRPNPPPELIHFLLDELPDGYGIPGQHDLYYHDLDSLKKTAYGVLVRAGKIQNLAPGETATTGKPGFHTVMLYGFPWNKPVIRCPDKECTFSCRIAVVHAYLWTKRCSHPGARKEDYIGTVRPVLESYDCAVYGDNHRGFLNYVDPDRPDSLINCGSFIRRKSDEIDNRPMIGCIRLSGKIEPHYLDVSKDRIISKESEITSNARVPIGILEFVEDLNKLNDEQLNFREALIRYLDSHDARPEVRRAVLESIE